MSFTLEICANSVQSAINAEQGGANRVELCDNLWEGGTTPSASSIKLAKERISILVFVLIRPRGGDFNYSDLEFDIMKEDIRIAKSLGADGIVSGILLPDGAIDIARTTELVELSKPLPFTFHRAFDLVKDFENALEDVILCGAQRILTSGLANSCTEGLSVLKSMNNKAQGRITIMPGGGITIHNIDNIAEQTGCKEFHCSAKIAIPSNSFHSSKVKMNGSSEILEDRYHESDINLVSQITKKLYEL